MHHSTFATIIGGLIGTIMSIPMSSFIITVVLAILGGVFSYLTNKAMGWLWHKIKGK